MKYKYIVTYLNRRIHKIESRSFMTLNGALNFWVKIDLDHGSPVIRKAERQ